MIPLSISLIFFVLFSVHGLMSALSRLLLLSHDWACLDAARRKGNHSLRPLPMLKSAEVTLIVRIMFYHYQNGSTLILSLPPKRGCSWQGVNYHTISDRVIGVTRHIEPHLSTSRVGVYTLRASASLGNVNFRPAPRKAVKGQLDWPR